MAQPTPPSGFNDFYELELKINYNNSYQQYLQGNIPSILTSPGTPQEQQAGWTERYLLNVLPNGANFPYAAAYSLTQARAAILGLNFYIKTAVGHQASVFKSSFPLPAAASLALFDSLSATSLPPQFCSSPEETIMLRGECSNLRRYEHQMRGVKDYMADDAMTYFAAPSYCAPPGGSPPKPDTTPFDTVQQTVPYVPATAPVPAAVTASISGNSITAVAISTNGNFPGVAAGTYPCFFSQVGGGANNAFGTVTINGSNQASAVTLNPNYPGSGYSSASVQVTISNDPYGLPNYLTPSFYWANFMSCMIAYTGSGKMRRISQTTFVGGTPGFPSGLVPVLVPQLYACTRCLFQRVGNRQTGQIRLTKPARVKRGIGAIN